jgi:hypothetical protein
MISKFRIGDLVTHINWGKGKVVAYSDDVTSINIEFDETPEGWDKTLEVSIDCLKYQQEVK